jgi:hypothetical protein
MPEIIELGYSARKQFAEFHARKERWAVMVCHRRAGKTVACVMDLIDAALRNPRRGASPPRYGYVAPLLKQAKTVAWEYLKHYGLKVPGAISNESELSVKFPGGASVRLFGADNPDSARGGYFDGLVLDEAADMSPSMFDTVLRPALSDYEGWCVWIGTPKGMNDFFDLWQKATTTEADRYYTVMMKASETGIVSANELIEAKRDMPPEMYAQEYECSFAAALVGAYYGKELEEAEEQGRFVTNLYDPGMEVHTSWDLGASDDTVIWFFQQHGFEIRWIDFHASNGFGFDYYAQLLQKRGYKYGTHHFPHDVTARVQGGGYVAESRKQTLEGLGIPVQVGPRVKDVSERINAVRRALPRSWFDRDKCADGLRALRQYRREYDDKRKVYQERPLHDWCSHPADAFGEGCIQLQGPKAAIQNMPKREMSWVV